MHIVIAGRYVESCDGTEIAVDPGGGLIKPPGLRHWNRFEEIGARSIRIEFDPAYVAGVSEALPGTLTVLDDEITTRSIGVRLLREVYRPGGGSTLMLRGLCLQLLAGAEIGDTSSLADRCADLIRDTWKTQVTVEGLATRLGVNRGHLARVFRQRHGCTISEFLRCLRAEQTAFLITSTDLPLVRVAIQSGFADQSHMSRVFRAVFGESPGAWRAQRRANRAPFVLDRSSYGNKHE